MRCSGLVRRRRERESWSISLRMDTGALGSANTVSASKQSGFVREVVGDGYCQRFTRFWSGSAIPGVALAACRCSLGRFGVALIASPAAGADTGTGADSVPGGSHSASAGAASSPSSSRGVGAPRRGGVGSRPGRVRVRSVRRLARPALPALRLPPVHPCRLWRGGQFHEGGPLGGRSPVWRAERACPCAGLFERGRRDVHLARRGRLRADLGECGHVRAGTYTATVTPVALTSSVASTVRASAVGGRGLSSPVTAPVTLRAILTEGLSWIGLGGLGDELPIHDAPLPDLLAGIWVGRARRTSTSSTPPPLSIPLLLSSTQSPA